MDTYLSMSEAAKITKVSVQVLNELALNGRIKSIITSTGDILVSASDVSERLIVPKAGHEKYSHLLGNPISISEASRKYALQHSTISRWVARGYITRLGQQGRQVLIDEAEIASYADIYQSKNGSQGKWIFDRDGLLYQKKR